MIAVNRMKLAEAAGPARAARSIGSRDPFLAARSIGSRDPFLAAMRSVRWLADLYYPGADRLAIVIGTSDPTTLGVPSAKVLGDGDLPPVGSVKQPGCAVAVVATLLQRRDTPMQAPEIEAVLRDSEVWPAFSLSSIEKTLAELIQTGLVRNPANARPRGYRLAE